MINIHCIISPATKDMLLASISRISGNMVYVKYTELPFAEEYLKKTIDSISMAKCVYKNRLGKRGELIAADYLKENGYKVIKSNYRYDRAEIDLICVDTKQDLLIFVEVKTRTNKKFGEPEESITPSKIEQIKKAAYGFLSENSIYDEFDVRLDVITVFFEEQDATINHIENAFL